MLKRKKKFDPPVRLWVIFDVVTGHPNGVFRDPDNAEPFEDEVIYEYTIQPRKK